MIQLFQPLDEVHRRTDGSVEVVLCILQIGQTGTCIDVLPEIFGWWIVISAGTTETLDGLLHLSHADVCYTPVVVGTDGRELAGFGETVAEGEGAIEIAHHSCPDDKTVHVGVNGSSGNVLLLLRILAATCRERSKCTGDAE